MTQLSLLRRPPEPLTAADYAQCRADERELVVVRMQLGKADAAKEEADAMGYSAGARLARSRECKRLTARRDALMARVTEFKRRASLGGGR